MGTAHVLARATASQIGARIEIMLVALDSTRVSFAATTEQADELAADLEEILDEDRSRQAGRRSMQ